MNAFQACLQSSKAKLPEEAKWFRRRRLRPWSTRRRTDEGHCCERPLDGNVQGGYLGQSCAGRNDGEGENKDAGGSSSDNDAGGGLDAVEDARAVERDVLLRDELDRLLRDEAAHEGRDLRKVRGAAPAAVK